MMDCTHAIWYGDIHHAESTLKENVGRGFVATATGVDDLSFDKSQYGSAEPPKGVRK